MGLKLTTKGVDETSVLMPEDADKHTRYRINKFTDWLDERGNSWLEPDLTAYRDDLLAQDYAPATVSAHLSTLRGQYERLLRDNHVRDSLEIAVRDGLEAQGGNYGPADVEALVNRAVIRLQNAIDPANSPVRVKVKQDVADSAHLRLTASQANALMAAPGLDDLKRLRDTAVIALMLCTGIREAELSALKVEDLRQTLGGELALHVREGKGCKERLIPYGELDWVLVIVEACLCVARRQAWMRQAGVDSGMVFRGLYKGGKLRPGALSVRAIQYILERYPVAINGDLLHVKPQDLRRTYARRLYESGVNVIAIQQNLGHANTKTTLGYIGTLDVDQRRPPAVYSFDLSRLLSKAGRID